MRNAAAEKTNREGHEGLAGRRILGGWRIRVQGPLGKLLYTNVSFDFKATAAWDAIIRQQFLDDLPAITALIELLRRHEETVVLAQAAGATRTLNVAHTFLTADEVATRLAYAKGQMGIQT